jgi:hypothetical protein
LNRRTGHGLMSDVPAKRNGATDRGGHRLGMPATHVLYSPRETLPAMEEDRSKSCWRSERAAACCSHFHFIKQPLSNKIEIKHLRE